MKRAIGDDQKTKRRLDIIESAAGLLSERDFDDVTLTDVASALGLVKGTLYKYFPTKEALVLEVLERELELWIVYLRTELRNNPVESTTGLSAVLARSLAQRSLLVRLFSIVHILLEKNLSLERLIAFKRKSLAALESGSELLESSWAPLAGKGKETILAFYGMAIGVGHLTERSPSIEVALETPGLGIFRLDFETQLQKTMTWLLDGILKPGKGK
ncbi:MAG: hypothetical protein A2087_10910 [Spirochaetes bacterium GWD1_61_31]|nr:MAG: hypothetical protein A2Y37_06925 [Spirochaetes bacterium GWB1_60_80]OHD30807.1 MAG: hypothetical protein A2004_04450 [Spirochaetes bacterium GWC1_61_12]OHD36402.1 MAG: hypothetical protein A2087_10910 [Spirochaetes bacterium GWD1_61_31]OHD46307.1 MAG: hypothetical protein A2Y35_07200 [Spirochaetes bacterium GWE1_60_18]OHD60914.1 MAG: hypothetical protein A2Y32_11945 [Spirochaetes bacterium GWF1_60_12]HAP42828.1 hypothetical protein [Spirochaetaceae bacterium]